MDFTHILGHVPLGVTCYSLDKTPNLCAVLEHFLGKISGRCCFDGSGFKLLPYSISGCQNMFKGHSLFFLLQDASQLAVSYSAIIVDVKGDLLPDEQQFPTGRELYA